MPHENHQKNGEDRRKMALRVVAVLVFLLVSASLVWTGLFVRDTLNKISGDAFMLSAEERSQIEIINLEELSELRNKIQKKNSLDAPRAGRLRNPFIEYVPEETEPTE